jgi:hypothetical protein
VQKDSELQSSSNTEYTGHPERRCKQYFSSVCPSMAITHELPRTKTVYLKSHEDAAHYLSAFNDKDLLLESKEHRASVKIIARQFLTNNRASREQD